MTGAAEITAISSDEEGSSEEATTGISSRIVDANDKEAMAAESSAAATKAEETKEVTVVETVDMGLFYFPYNSDQANYGAQSENYLRRVAKIANDSGKKIILTGHTDNRGDAASNMVLGQQRADEVKRKLISLGVPNSKIIARSKGQTEPTASNETASGRQQNRRVELILE
jgi:outer membrane protein OmpA-like peptidoglycan-associated protein